MNDQERDLLNRVRATDELWIYSDEDLAAAQTLLDMGLVASGESHGDVCLWAKATIFVDVFHACGHGFAGFETSLDQFGQTNLLDTKTGPAGWVHSARITLDLTGESSLKRAIAIAERLFQRSNLDYPTAWYDDEDVTMMIGSLPRYTKGYDQHALETIKKRSHMTSDVFCVTFPEDDCSINLGCDSVGWRVLGPQREVTE